MFLAVKLAIEASEKPRNQSQEDETDTVKCVCPLFQDGKHMQHVLLIYSLRVGLAAWPKERTMKVYDAKH